MRYNNLMFKMWNIYFLWIINLVFSSIFFFVFKLLRYLKNNFKMKRFKKILIDAKYIYICFESFFETKVLIPIIINIYKF